MQNRCKLKFPHWFGTSLTEPGPKTDLNERTEERNGCLVSYSIMLLVSKLFSDKRASTLPRKQKSSVITPAAEEGRGKRKQEH